MSGELTIKKMIITAVITLVLAPISSAYAHTEESDAALIKKFYDGARNSAGLISYCAEQGLLPADSIDIAQQAVARWHTLPQVKDTSDGDKMEALGREGKLSNGEGPPIPLQDAAHDGVENWCQHMDNIVRKAMVSAKKQ